MFVRSCLALSLLLLLTSCTRSINPLYQSEKELVTDSAIWGVWNVPKSKGTVTLVPEGRIFLFRFDSNDQAKPEEIRLEARLVRLGKFSFADLSAPLPKRKSDWPDLYLPAHAFVRYEVRGDRLRFWAMREEWSKAPTTVQLAVTQKDVITAETPSIQAFLKEHATDPLVFGSEAKELIKAVE